MMIITMRDYTLFINKIFGHDTYARWLCSLFILTLIMLVVGGLTRLTESGLSIVEWKVVVDILPPLNQQDWNKLFGLYQQTEQYKELGSIFSIDDFKRIFWWEYSHRLLARLLGAVLGVGVIVLALTGGWRNISKQQKWGLLALFLLGAMQAVVGKWMVESGLFVSNSVAPLNLVAHFFMAVIILFVLYAMMATYRGQVLSYHPFRLVLTLVLLMTLCLGSLTAGAKAGYAYGTWPLMGDNFVPTDYWWQGNQESDVITLDGDADKEVGQKPADEATQASRQQKDNIMNKKLHFWQNAVLNPSAIHFHHRLFAYFSFFMIYYYFFMMRRDAKKTNNKLLLTTNFPTRDDVTKAACLAVVASLQVFLGILLVVNTIPFELAMLHQWVGICTILIAFSTWFRYPNKIAKQKNK